MQETFTDLYLAFFAAHLVVAPGYLLIGLVAAWIFWRIRRIGGNFWHWLVPMRIYLHHSHLIDLQLFLITRGLAALGILGAVTVTTLMATSIASLMPAPVLQPGALSPILLAFVLWLPSDFANYWVHRLHHSWSVIWPFHAVHHSAEVLTPLTTYRQHPIGNLLAACAQSVIVGVIQGVLVGALSPEAQIAEIAGINACIVMANAALAALHHSHVWLSYGPVLEYLVISPAQHQIHHSKDPNHYNRNFGTSLAVWDWLFGTLYVIRGPESLEFGLDEEKEKSLMTQRLWFVLWDPVNRVLRRSG